MIAATADETIEIDDVCAVGHLSIRIPKNGGVVVLRGPNGSGKSSILRSLQRLATGRKDLAITARDGVQRGEISGFGVTLRVGKSVTRTGEYDRESLDGRLSVAELVDPGLKGELEADAKRIRALVQLAGVTPDVNIFADLLDERKDFDEVVKGKNLDTDDILVLADRIKRAIDEAARNAEGQANIEKSKSAACKESANGIALNVETDDAKLQKILEDAIRHEQNLRSKSVEAIRRNAEISAAKEKIAEARGSSESLSTEEIQELVNVAHESMMSAQDAVDKKRKEIRAAIERMNEELAVLASESALADERWSGLTRELAQSQRFDETVAELTSTIDAGELVGPTEQEISDAADAVANSRASIEAGVLARRANEQLEKAKIHAKAEDKALAKANTLREAAKRVDDVLSEQIAKLGVALQVKAGRLVTQTKRGAGTLYAELSEGERWKIALDIAIEAVGTDGILYIPQPAYEALDPDNRQKVIDRVTGNGVVIMTAESTSGVLRAEIESATAA